MSGWAVAALLVFAARWRPACWGWNLSLRHQVLLYGDERGK